MGPIPATLRKPRSYAHLANRPLFVIIAVYGNFRAECIALHKGQKVLSMSPVIRVQGYFWGMCLILSLTACSGSASPAVATAPTATPTTMSTPSPIPVLPTATPLAMFTPSPTLTPTATSTPVVYVVRVGDSAWAISRRLGISVDALFQVNGLDRSSTLHPGQELVVPTESEPLIATNSAPAVAETGPGNGSAAESAAQPEADALPGPTGDNPAVGRESNQPLERQNPAGAPAATPTPAARSLGGPKAKAAAASETIHVVESGDSLSGIAIQYGASIEVVMEANGIMDPTRLRVGQKLVIPPGTATPVPTATSYPSPTPTPAMPYMPPSLLWPINGTSLAADEEAVLSWATVGILDPEEYYEVRLWRLRGPEVTESWAEWTRQTSWRIIPDIRALEQTKGQLYRWEVIVMRHTGTEDDGTWTGEPLSAPSAERQFLWPLPVRTIVTEPIKGGIPLPSSPAPFQPEETPAAE